MKLGGVKVDYVSTTVWDPGLLIVDALRKLGTGATSNQIKEWLSGLKGWVGSNGTYHFVRFPVPGSAQIRSTSLSGIRRRMLGQALAARAERNCANPTE
jgi:hypothetical protein